MGIMSIKSTIGPRSAFSCSLPVQCRDKLSVLAGYLYILDHGTFYLLQNVANHGQGRPRPPLHLDGGIGTLYRSAKGQRHRCQVLRGTELEFKFQHILQPYYVFHKDKQYQSQHVEHLHHLDQKHIDKQYSILFDHFSACSHYKQQPDYTFFLVHFRSCSHDKQQSDYPVFSHHFQPNHIDSTWYLPTGR